MKLISFIFLLHLSVFNLFAQSGSKISIGKLVLDSHLDSVQKTFDFQLVKKEKVDCDAILKDLGVLPWEKKLRYRQKYKYSSKLNFIEVLGFYQDELSGTGGLIKEVSHYSIEKIKINDYLFLEDVDLKFYSSFLYEISCKMQLNSPVGNKEVLLPLLVTKFGNEYKNERYSENYLWETPDYSVEFKGSNFSLTLTQNPIFNLIKRDENLIISQKIIELKEKTKEGVKEGF